MTHDNWDMALAAAAALARRAGRALGLERLAGPILGKELRVSSRRKSQYFLRLVYVACLTLYVSLTWAQTTSGLAGGQMSYEVSRMAQAGQTIVIGILNFQFVATQVLALFMLGTAIPSEIVRGTLATLACTPISSFQIVMGKLLSKLFQVMLLVAVSLPLMAIVRVFGGVPLGMVLAGLAVTVSSVVLVGAWSLMLSIRYRSLLRIVIVTAVVYFATNLVGLWISSAGSFPVGPAATMEYVTKASLVSSATADFWAAWIVNCAGMLGLALLFLRSAARGLREEIAQPSLRSVSTLDTLRRMRREAITQGRPQRVRGPALIWKDLRTFLPATRGRAYAGCGAALGTLAISYLPFLDSRAMDLPGSHQFYLFLYLVAGAFVTVLASSTAITVEKESRALPILLTAPITDTQIILSKATGVFYRALAAWILLTAHVWLFTLLGQIHWAGALALLLVMAYLAIFLTGLGLYVSSRLRSSSAAVTLTVAVCFLLWYVLPMLAASVPSELLPGFDWAVRAANPFVQVYLIAHGAIDQGIGGSPLGDLHFQWHGKHLAVGEAAGVFVMTFLLYVNAGLLLAGRAKVLMRRRLFA